jgi:hypothetical protein
MREDADDSYMAMAVPAFHEGLDAFWALAGPTEGPADALYVVERLLDLLNASDYLTSLTPPPQHARLHQDLLTTLDTARAALCTAIGGESPIAQAAAMADVAEELRILEVRVGRELRLES